MARSVRPARRLNGVPILVLDGAMGTYLEDRYGVVFDASKPAWSSSVDPDLVAQVHRDYIDAGADIVLTATYQATRENMQASESPQHGDAERRVAKLVESAVAAVDEASGERKNASPSERSGLAVGLSIGPYGATMKPSTEYSFAYPPQMKHLSALKEELEGRLAYLAPERLHRSCSISYIAFETLTGTLEIEAARQVMGGSAYSDGGGRRKNWWVCANYPDNPRVAGTIRSPAGDRPGDVYASALQDASDGHPAPWGIGVNCTKLHLIAEIVRGYEDGLDRLAPGETGPGDHQHPWLVLYPDGAQNLRYNAETKQWDPVEGSVRTGDRTKSWAAQVMEILVPITERRRAGRCRWPGIVVGGCCKTTPTDIRELVGLLAEMSG